MMELKARCIVEGEAKGEVVFTSQPIAFLQGVDPEKGYVSDPKHELYTVPFKDKILVFPNSVGSSVGAYVIYRLKMNDKAPRAFVNKTSDIITASGCAISRIPLFDVGEECFLELKKARTLNYVKEKSVLRYY